MKRWMIVGVASVVGVLLLVLAIPGGTRAQGFVSQGCHNINASGHNALYISGGDGGPFVAGDLINFTAGYPVIGNPTIVSVTLDHVVTQQTAFPGTITVVIPTDGSHYVEWGVNNAAGATWTLNCVPASSYPPPPQSPTHTVGQPVCFGQAATIYVKNGAIVGGPDNGTTYSGILNGTTGDDVIVGTDGNDIILSGNGNDMICAGGGNDTVSSGAGNDQIDGGAGNDRLAGGPDNDVLTGGSGTDSFDGGPGTDFVTDRASNESQINVP